MVAMTGRTGSTPRGCYANERAEAAARAARAPPRAGPSRVLSTTPSGVASSGGGGRPVETPDGVARSPDSAREARSSAGRYRKTQVDAYEFDDPAEVCEYPPNMRTPPIDGSYAI